mmetsp:Transcript_10238/g.23347  ORF Transcript_10238/g.23347 Transcript_10238/m.23347 type:complete len:269 (-) Transcript_10238:961-1767(-)
MAVSQSNPTFVSIADVFATGSSSSSSESLPEESLSSSSDEDSSSLSSSTSPPAAIFAAILATKSEASESMELSSSSSPCSSPTSPLSLSTSIASSSPSSSSDESPSSTKLDALRLNASLFPFSLSRLTTWTLTRSPGWYKFCTSFTKLSEHSVTCARPLTSLLSIFTNAPYVSTLVTTPVYFSFTSMSSIEMRSSPESSTDSRMSMSTSFFPPLESRTVFTFPTTSLPGGNIAPGSGTKSSLSSLRITLASRERDRRTKHPFFDVQVT